MTAARRRLQGVVFIAVLLGFVGLVVGRYAGVFESGVPVTLQVERAGSQLAERADVKVRGLVVGEVKSISTEGGTGGATVRLTLDPELAGQIPADVSARLLPKTLFGEKYVSLVFPAADGAVMTSRPISAGDVISQDRSETARELEQVLDGLLPLLQAVEPQDLATTLGALSGALAGRGEQLGDTLVRLQELTGGLRPAIGDLQADITELADFARNLDAAAPDLLAALEDLTVPSHTVAEGRAGLRALLGGITRASDDLRAFLAVNRDNLIALAGSSRPTLATLARYAPQFPCLFEQIAGLLPLLDASFGKGSDRPGIHITLEIVSNRGKYEPNQDEPRYADDRGPRCYPIQVPGPQYPPDGPFRDGSMAPAPPPDTPRGGPETFGAETYGSYDGTNSWGLVRRDAGVGKGAGGGFLPITYDGMGVANSPGEQQLVAELVAAQTGATPEEVPAWSTLLVGPLYRGAEVRLA